MIYLVRHGESKANIQKRFSGVTDVELSNKGELQAKIIGQSLCAQNISHIFTSPLKRAVATAKIIQNEISFSQDIIIEKSLIEVNFGLFENLTWEEISEKYKEESETWIVKKHKYKFPEGEDYNDIIKRISHLTDTLPDNSLIVTHFGVIQAILLYLKIVDEINLWDIVIGNCDVIVLDEKKGKIEKIIRNKNI